MREWTVVRGDWYEENIEEPIRPLVKLLRNEGFNTVASCGHEMWVDLHLMLDGEPYRLHKTLFDWLASQGEEISYTIEVRYTVHQGHLTHRARVCLLGKPAGHDGEGQADG